MGRHLVWLLLTVVLIAGCAAPQPLETAKPAVVVVAIPPEMAEPGLGGVTYLRTAAPLQALQRGEAAMAVVAGPLPAGQAGFVYQVDEQVLMQGWLDPPISLSRAEAEAALAKARPMGEPGVGGAGPGVLAKGLLSDLRLGWRAVPVDGVTPTPESLWDGAYPLATRYSVAIKADLSAEERAAVDGLRRLAKPPPEPWATLTVAGDFMLARGVNTAMRNRGTLYPIERVKAHLAAADLAFANLESPIGVTGRPLPGKQIWFRAAPEAAELLKASGLDAVTVANNHILDYDEENFLETLALLDQIGLRYVGGGNDLAEARQPLVMEAKGVKVAFLGYSQFADLFFDWDYPRSFAATEDRPGVPGIEDAWLAEDIAGARAKADIVAVSLHWGEEFQNYPTAEQERIARLCIDLGADLVLGYHPHSIQGFELYKGGFIVYSTGNFIMDNQENDLARESMLLDFQIAKDGVRSVAVHPVWIHAEQPYIMAGAEGERLLQKMREISGWR